MQFYHAPDEMNGCLNMARLPWLSLLVVTCSTCYLYNLQNAVHTVCEPIADQREDTKLYTLRLRIRMNQQMSTVVCGRACIAGSASL